MSSCASYVSRTHYVIDDVTRSQSSSNFEIDIFASIFELLRRSKAQNVGNTHGYISGIFNFRYNFRLKSLSRAQNGGHFEHFEILNTASIWPPIWKDRPKLCQKKYFDDDDVIDDVTGCQRSTSQAYWVTLAIISNIANYLKYNYFWDCDGIDNVVLRLSKFSDFCSRHIVGVAGYDIMFHILVCFFTFFSLAYDVQNVVISAGFYVNLLLIGSQCNTFLGRSKLIRLYTWSHRPDENFHGCIDIRQ